ncbi:MAG: DUF3164 family protein [Flavobacteriales bacterium]
MKTENVNLDTISTDDLEKLIAKRKEDKRKAEIRERKAYEKGRDNSFDEIFNLVLEYELMGRKIKEKCHVVFDGFNQKLIEYGEMPSKSKGGFTVAHSDGNRKARRTRQTDRKWDERAEKAIELLKSFLDDTIRKKDKDTYDLLMLFIAKNKAGELDYAHVMQLLEHENKYIDKRWVEGLKLIKESYTNTFKAYGYEFEIRDESSGKFRKIVLNFSSI